VIVARETGEAPDPEDPRRRCTTRVDAFIFFGSADERQPEDSLLRYEEISDGVVTPVGSVTMVGM
jgi:hypothetical protein